VKSAGAAGLVVRGEATDDSGIARVDVYVGGHRVVTTTDGRWEKTVPLEQAAPAADAPRAVRVIVVARDRLGNASARLQDISLP